MCTAVEVTLGTLGKLLAWIGSGCLCYGFKAEGLTWLLLEWPLHDSSSAAAVGVENESCHCSASLDGCVPLEAWVESNCQLDAHCYAHVKVCLHLDYVTTGALLPCFQPIALAGAGATVPKR